MPTITPSHSIRLSQNAALLAESSGEALQRLIADEAKTDENPLHVSVERSDGVRAEMKVPSSALPLLVSLLKELGHGKQVTVFSKEAELTTQQAADLLHVSRPYLVKLLRAGQIPFRSVGPRRRVRLEDVLRYQEQAVFLRYQGLDALVAEAQTLGMY